MYNIMRAKKHKTRSSITAASEHNLRLRTQPNIDDSQSHLNRVLYDSLKIDQSRAASFQEKISQHYETLGVKEKKDNVLALEFVVSASPEFFDGTPEHVESWSSKQIEFFSKEFGENMKLAVLHLDEKTPHLHIFVTPEQKKTQKYKNQHGEFHKETVSLNAKRWNPKFLEGLHTRHAAHNEPFGLHRGKKGSKALNKPVKEHYAELAQDLEKVKLNKQKVEIFDRLREMFYGAIEQINLMFEILEKHDISDEDKKTVDSIATRYSEAMKPRAKSNKAKSTIGG